MAASGWRGFHGRSEGRLLMSLSMASQVLGVLLGRAHSVLEAL